jgi:hypothetical protein
MGSGRRLAFAWNGNLLPGRGFLRGKVTASAPACPPRTTPHHRYVPDARSRNVRHERHEEISRTF